MENEGFWQRIRRWWARLKQALARRWWWVIVAFVLEQGCEVLKHRIYGGINVAIDERSPAIWQHLKPLALYAAGNPALITVMVFALVVAVLTVHAYLDTLPTSPNAAQTLKTESRPKLVIHSALYGAGDDSDIQVAEKLNAQKREGLIFAVNNNLVNRDPAPGKPKHLVVRYSWDAGQTLTVTIPDDGWLMLPRDPQLVKCQTELEATKKELATAKQKQPSGNLQIFSPLDNSEVGLWKNVKGAVYPPNSDLQVLVRAGEYWYLQGPAKVDGASWNRDCKFGRDGDTGSHFKVVALLGKHVTEDRIRELPVGVPRSEEVAVKRAGDSDDRESPRSGLQGQAERLSDEIRDFLRKSGPQPVRKDDPKQHTEAEELEAARKHSAESFSWMTRFQGGWVGRFQDRVEKIRYLLAEQGIIDQDLDMALRAPLSEGKIRRIADRLLVLSRAEPMPPSRT